MFTSILSISRMSKIGFMIISIFLIIAMGGCSITYKTVVTYSDIKNILIGTVRHNIIDGSASFQFKGRDSELSCNGIGERPYYIPSSWTCEGQRGRGFGTCSDGRTLKFEWVADTCTLIYGKGEDSLGNSFYFTAGMSEEEVNDYIDKIQNGMSEEKAKDYIKQLQEKPKGEMH